MNIHEKYIKRCIDIGKNGLGTTAPNPMVGCVIVHANKIIGEGFTSPFGGAHAEVNAINSVKDQSLLSKSTLYVTLEPCSHYGKTPPCADAIIAHNIPKIVIGTIDTHSKVAGKGVAKLEAAGCEVIVGILEDDVKAHHKRFFTFHNKQRPYVILKWAETSDGFIAPQTRDAQQPVWITNQLSRQLVHKWRAEEQSILVGTNTVIADNPSLTVRDWTGKNPIRVILDRELKLNSEYILLNNDAKNLIIHGDNAILPKPEANQKSWSLHPPLGRGFDAIYIEIDWSLENTIAKQICTILYNNNINSVIIEGGRQTLQTFINENLWDEARVFTGPTTFGAGTKAPQCSGKLVLKQNLFDDTLKIIVND
ncbi:bifunctional diaminohydroxyphosphoribosylaminopyrimidine deaminase/5-amino-6-(5-phosphoribosylamino)uracil reductase RibD [Gelidibacter salicanalis]|uniref:Riboflavin biosynthesis protein RibD n=1 Tax=Gelidibacter salicanalis TaxID=291193 RepID=A0A5C7AFW6_9FLAO|nr:bifunctional diaminohydroxyphosphoribosylaminopyrimidine deaminase/5-amino-6-(5-phosphoribosylamino)uracil reductase RibD [Gelidibacter salicanalis]TXE07656.1 bifunctional diaminohydroxyphosphoribosylaminopyrimidine deaminase/5-amino-6-(5-phosphoribosylamino)uracil reductase RibD [Gelidibacter salicanalis]